MRVFVTGVTGVMGAPVVRALHSAGHAVAGLARDDVKAEGLRALDVEPVRGTVFDLAALTRAFEGSDAVCNLATAVPVGARALRPGAWRTSDRIRSQGARIVAKAAREAGVGRLVQESVSFLYADSGDDWIDESSPVAVNRATEPVVLAETAAEAFRDAGHQSVVLRFGVIIGDDPLTRWRLSRARVGSPIGLGDPDGWAHVVHADDIGTAVNSALTAPSGVYNAGAEPVRRADLVRGFAEAVGRHHVGFLSRRIQRLGGERLEPLTRSQRVSSAALGREAAWKPHESDFSADWLAGLT